MKACFCIPFGARSQRFVAAVFFLCSLLGQAETASANSRYFFHGDGKLGSKKSSVHFENLQPRLKALLDYLQDQLTQGKGEIRIISGHRSRQYNESLRRKGKLAAKASLHLEGMAADFSLQGVAPKTLWNYIRNLDCCGAGFYSGSAVHVDTGPSRFWDQTSSKVFTDISNSNKQIYLTTDYDVYYPGERLSFKIVRVTEYPFGVSKKALILKGTKPWKEITLDQKESCREIQNQEDSTRFVFSLPEETTPPEEKLKLKVTFCQKPSEEMPAATLSNPFIIAPLK